MTVPSQTPCCPSNDAKVLGVCSMFGVTNVCSDENEVGIRLAALVAAQSSGSVVPSHGMQQNI